jgi:hypothetical protein
MVMGVVSRLRRRPERHTLHWPLIVERNLRSMGWERRRRIAANVAKLAGVAELGE